MIQSEDDALLYMISTDYKERALVAKSDYVDENMLMTMMIVETSPVVILLIAKNSKTTIGIIKESVERMRELIEWRPLSNDGLRSKIVSKYIFSLLLAYIRRYYSMYFTKDELERLHEKLCE